MGRAVEHTRVKEVDAGEGRPRAPFRAMEPRFLFSGGSVSGRRPQGQLEITGMTISAASPGAREAELSTVSEIALKPNQKPEYRDNAKPNRPKSGNLAGRAGLISGASSRPRISVRSGARASKTDSRDRRRQARARRRIATRLRIRMFQRICRTVDARPLAIPNAKHAIDFGAGKGPNSAAPYRRRGEVLVQAGGKRRCRALAVRLRAPQRIVIIAERRTAIA